MLVLKVLLLAVCFAAASSAPTKSQFVIEILSQTKNSVTARFQPYKRVKKYFVSVGIKDLMDAPSDYVVDLVKADKNADGYYYINAGTNLQPGNLYEISVYNKRKFTEIGRIEFFTDCDEYSYQCVDAYGQICLSSEQLCDGHATCSNGEDEDKNEDGSCVVTVPKRPTIPPPPPPPSDAPCVVALTNAMKMGISPLPVCEVDGTFAAMDCVTLVTYTCRCVHPITGKILHTQPDFDPFTHWNYGKMCDDVRKAVLATPESPILTPA